MRLLAAPDSHAGLSDLRWKLLARPEFPGLPALACESREAAHRCVTVFQNCALLSQVPQPVVQTKARLQLVTLVKRPRKFGDHMHLRRMPESLCGEKLYHSGVCFNNHHQNKSIDEGHSLQKE